MSLLSYRRLADVEMRSVEWLEKPLFQRAAFQLIAGRKGAGKGTYIAGLTARVTRGELHGRPMNVLLIASEDSDEIDILPRVVAAGGDPARVFSVNEHVRLPKDIARIKQAAETIGDIGLIVLDPISSFIGAADSDGEVAVRVATDPLNALAHDLDTLILGVRHLGKDSSRGALASVLGSVAWVNVPRAVLMIVPDDEDDSLSHVAVVAGNRSARGGGRSFRIDLVTLDGLAEPVTRAVDAGTFTKSLDDLVSNEKSGRAVKRDAAADVILRELAIQPRPMEYLKAKCSSETGSSGDTTWRAANALKSEGKVSCRNSGPGTPWLWSLTSPAHPDTEVIDFMQKSEPDFLTSATGAQA